MLLNVQGLKVSLSHGNPSKVVPEDQKILKSSGESGLEVDTEGGNPWVKSMYAS